MNSKMRLLLLLLNLLIIKWTQQSEIANYTLEECKYMNKSGMEMAELRFQGHLDGASCSLQMSVTATQSIEECLEDIEINNTSCLLNRTGVLPTVTSTVTVNQTVKTTEFVTITSIHTQEVYSQTTVSICPMPTPSSSTVSHLVTSTVSTTSSSDSTSPPTTRFALSNAAQVGILATSGVLMCLPISAALVIVTYCWIRTRRTLKEREGTGTNFRIVYSARDRFPKSPSVHTNSDDDNETAIFNEFDNPVYYDNRMATLVNLKPIAVEPTSQPLLPGNDNSLHDEHQTATATVTQEKNSQPTVKAKPILPKHHEEQTITITAAAQGKNSETTANRTSLLISNPALEQSEAQTENLKRIPIISPLFPRRHKEKAAATSEKNSKPSAKATPIFPRHVSYETLLDQKVPPAENLKAESKRKSVVPICTSDDTSPAQISKPKGKTIPLLPRHLRDDAPLDHQTATSADSSTKAKPLLPKHLNNTSESQTEENSKAATKPKPLVPRHPSNEDSERQLAKHTENPKSTTKVKPLLPKHLKNDNSDNQAATQAENTKPATKSKPLLPRHLNADSQTSKQPESSKPAIKTKPILPRRPSNGPIYAPLCNSDNKEMTNGAHQEKAGRGVTSRDSDPEKGKESERTAGINKRKELEPKYDKPLVAAKGKEDGGRTKKKEVEHKYDEPTLADEGRKGINKKRDREHKYDEPITAAMGKEDDQQVRKSKRKELDHKYDEPFQDDGKTSTSKKRDREHKYDEPITTVAGTEDKQRTSTYKRKEVEHKYDEPILEDEGRTSTSKRSNREHKYDEPTVTVEAKEMKDDRRVGTKKEKECDHLYDEPSVAVQGRKESGGRTRTNKKKQSEHKYDEPTDGRPSANKRKEPQQHQYAKPVIAAKPKILLSKKERGTVPGRKAERKYHVLEGPVQRKGDNQGKKEDHKYHVLEGPAPSEEKGSKNQNKQEGDNLYHVLEGPTPSDENNSKEPNKRESDNVYHVLEGPIPIDGSNDRNLDKNEEENIYHVLEDPEEDNSQYQDDWTGENVYHILEDPQDEHSKHPDEWEGENVYHVLEGPTSVEDER